MRSQIGTRHLDTPKMKRKPSKIFSILLNLPELANLLTSGGSDIRISSTTHIFRTVLIVEAKASVGDWICVSFGFWRVTYPKFTIRLVVVSERLVEKVKMCEIRSDIYGASDHVPVVMEIESDILMGN